jgi:hypothetical protein
MLSAAYCDHESVEEIYRLSDWLDFRSFVRPHHSVFIRQSWIQVK